MGARLLRLVGAMAIAAFGLTSAAACQVALRAEDEAARCAPDGVKCGAGMTCDNGICRTCVPKPEECNLVDDDCDGEIDEDFDLDGDGFKQCGAAEKVDCNDDPKRGGRAVFPGAPELCNGYDDNCDGVTDESPNNCGDDSECWSAKGQCTVKGDCRIHGCAQGKGCNGETGACSELDCRLNAGLCIVGEQCSKLNGVCEKITGAGEPCDVSAKCTAGYSCIELERAGISARAAAICTKGCCESTGCPDNFVCKRGTTGSSLCVKSEDVGLVTGSRAANARCGTGSDCRSGVCTGGFCIDGCCGNIACGDNGTCSFRGSGDRTFLCRAPAGGTSPQSSCWDDGECTTGFCDGAGTLGGRCSKRCCSSEDCFSGWRCGNFTYTPGGPIFSACTRLGSSTGLRRGGESCTGDGDCRSARCVKDALSGSLYCSDTCCRDSDCGGGAVCRPTPISGGVALRCVPVAG